MNPYVALSAALGLTVAITLMALLAGFVAAMPDGTLGTGVTIRERIELYVGAALTLAMEGQVWLSLAAPC